MNYILKNILGVIISVMIVYFAGMGILHLLEGHEQHNAEDNKNEEYTKQYQESVTATALATCLDYYNYTKADDEHTSLAVELYIELYCDNFSKNYEDIAMGVWYDCWRTDDVAEVCKPERYCSTNSAYCVEWILEHMVV